ncbi:phage portal protein [Clostridium tagluense]|uniref:Phage portal protein n=1 Tax=Clostridium tagluense TaxID=360422 RepID=A0A401UM25_9CLOT|nr:phage portal protein [Clostridium tagluense]GCD10584.1 phage portal protein [Clostridium tagluense]
MGIFNKVLSKEIKNEVTVPTGGGLKWLSDNFGQANLTNSGEVITKEGSLTISAVYACVSVRANTIASMPLQTFKTGKNGSTRQENEISYLLETRPNPFMAPFRLKHSLSTHIDLYGNGYIYMEISNGKVNNLWLLNPQITTTVIDAITGKVTYQTTINGKPKTFLENEIIHLTDLSLDGIIGKSKIDLLREQLGNMQGSSKLLGKYLKQGTTTSGVITYPTVLDEEVKDTIREAWQTSNSGSDNFGKVAILDMGLDYKEMNTLKFADQQFLENSKFTVEEIARVFSTPLHMIGELSKSSFNNIQQQSLDFVMKTIQPILTLWEQEFTYKLFAKGKKIFVEFNMSSALRSDDNARSTFYERMMNNGVYTINDVLKYENKNTIGDIGDIRYRSLNFVSIEKMDEYQMAKAKSGSKDDTDTTVKEVKKEDE